MRMASCLTLVNLTISARLSLHSLGEERGKGGKELNKNTVQPHWGLKYCCRTSRWSMRVQNLFCAGVCICLHKCIAFLFGFHAGWDWEWDIGGFVFLRTCFVHRCFCDMLRYDVMYPRVNPTSCSSLRVAGIPLYLSSHFIGGEVGTLVLHRLWVVIHMIAETMALVRDVNLVIILRLCYSTEKRVTLSSPLNLILLFNFISLKKKSKIFLYLFYLFYFFLKPCF